MDQVLEHVRADYPDIAFVEGATFYWSPLTKQVSYARHGHTSEIAAYSILHELSHALLGHTAYHSDYELLSMELAAWEHAKKLAANYHISIAEDHVQDCLDTYRDWLYKRSICPRCGTKSLQQDMYTYQCYNCHKTWRVAVSRFCRPYRRHAVENKKSPAALAATDDSIAKL